MDRDDEANMLMLAGDGPTAPVALQVLLDQLPLPVERPTDGDERAAVIRASAATLDDLIPRFVSAMWAAEEDLELTATAVALDGLLATDDGWRAWGTLTGQTSAGFPSGHRWMPDQATVERAHGAVSLRLTLRKEDGDD